VIVGFALPSFRLPSPSLSSRDSITARRPARAVVFHCCERMQIAIPVPGPGRAGPSINSNRINSSAVIVFCASQKTLYTRASIVRFAPLRTISGSCERLCTSPTSPRRSLDASKRAREREREGEGDPVWKLDRTDRGLDITLAIDHFIGNYRQRSAGDVSVQRTA